MPDQPPPPRFFLSLLSFTGQARSHQADKARQKATLSREKGVTLKSLVVAVDERGD